VRHSSVVTVAALLLCATALATPPAVTLAPRAATLRMAVVGDAGDGTEAVARGLARVHAATPLDAILLPGDNIYPCGVRSVSDPRWSLLRPLAALGVPLFPVLGNHDYCGDPEAQIAATSTFPQWNFPARTYVIRTGVADFAMLDTTPYVNGRAPLPDVASLVGQSEAPWRIAVGHHTIVSSGWHGYFPRDEHRRMLALLKPLRSARVDLYVCGHDHHLELVEGRPFMLISGASSDPIPPVALHPHTLFPPDARRLSGFAVIEVSRETLTVRFFDLGGGGGSRVRSDEKREGAVEKRKAGVLV
jgi:tartrate-resistant acid phosphatase type 5